MHKCQEEMQMGCQGLGSADNKNADAKYFFLFFCPPNSYLDIQIFDNVFKKYYKMKENDF